MKRAKALRIIREFEKAVRRDEFRGTLHPKDSDDAHARYLVLRERLLITLVELQGQ